MSGKKTAPNIDALESLLQEAVKLQDFGRASELQSRLIDAREAHERHLRPAPAAGSERVSATGHAHAALGTLKVQAAAEKDASQLPGAGRRVMSSPGPGCLLYTSDAADE